MQDSQTNNLAPIALFAYNRLDYLQQTIEALKKNELASDSELIIISDGPKNQEASIKVKDVRKFLRTVSGFKSITIIEREKNFGLANNIIAGTTEIVTQYGKIIVLEDDLVTSPYFLRYMNSALDLYEHNEAVISIHAYMYPVDESLPQTFFIKGADCLGWATWARGWKLFESNGEILLNKLISQKKKYEFDFNNTYPYLRMLQDQIVGKNSSWAVRWYASAFLTDKLTLYPCKTLVSHIGYDSGTHCNGQIQLPEQLCENPMKVQPIPVQENEEAKKEIMRYFRNKKVSLILRIWRKVRSIIRRI